MIVVGCDTWLHLTDSQGRVVGRFGELDGWDVEDTTSWRQRLGPTPSRRQLLATEPEQASPTAGRRQRGVKFSPKKSVQVVAAPASRTVLPLAFLPSSLRAASAQTP